MARPKVDASSPPLPRHNLEIGYNAPDKRGRRYCESAHSSPPKYCCVVPGDDALGTEGQEKAPNAQACPPRVNVCLQKLPVSDIRSPCSGRGEGRLQAECRKEPTFRVSVPPHLRGSDCAGGGSGGPQVTAPPTGGLSRTLLPHSPPGRPGWADSLPGGLAVGRGPGGHLGASREPRGRCWWWRSGWGQTRDTRHTRTTLTDE